MTKGVANMIYLYLDDLIDLVRDLCRQAAAKDGQDADADADAKYRWMTSMFDAQDCLGELTNKDFASMLFDGSFNNYSTPEGCTTYWESVYDMMYENAGNEEGQDSDDFVKK
jgi:hypothetical protein